MSIEKKFAPPRKKLVEIVQRLKLEPQIREMYVEGIFDRDFYRQALKSLGILDVQVYPIDAVDVPPELLFEKGLTDGARQRVQVSASHFVKSSDLHHQILFLIDADLDYALDAEQPVPPLVWTDGTAAEIILWNKRVLERFFEIALARQAPADEVATVMPFVESVVTQVFGFRAAKQKAQKNWKLVEIDETFTNKENFCFERYCNKIASKNNAHREIENEIIPILKDLEPRIKELKVERKMHGHDLMAVLAKKMQLIGFKHGCLNDPDELGRMLLASLDWSSVAADKTIEILRKKFPPPNKNVSGVFG